MEFHWGRDFKLVQTGPGAHPASCKMGTGSFPELKCGLGVLLNTHTLLVPRSWKSRTITLPTIWATLGLDWTWIYHLPERKHVVLRCWKDTAWTSSTHILYENGVVYSTSQCLLTTDKFQILPDIIGNTQATIDPTKLYVHRPSCHRRESRNASTRGGDTSRDCPAGRPQIPSRDTSPNHRHGFTSQHEQDYNPT